MRVVHRTSIEQPVSNHVQPGSLSDDPSASRVSVANKASQQHGFVVELEHVRDVSVVDEIGVRVLKSTDRRGRLFGPPTTCERPDSSVLMEERREPLPVLRAVSIET